MCRLLKGLCVTRGDCLSHGVHLVWAFAQEQGCHGGRERGIAVQRAEKGLTIEWR